MRVPGLGEVAQHLHFRQPVAGVSVRQRRLWAAVFGWLPMFNVPRHLRGEDGLLVIDHLQNASPAQCGLHVRRVPMHEALTASWLLEQRLHYGDE